MVGTRQLLITTLLVFTLLLAAVTPANAALTDEGYRSEARKEYRRLQTTVAALEMGGSSKVGDLGTHRAVLESFGSAKEHGVLATGSTPFSKTYFSTVVSGDQARDLYTRIVNKGRPGLEASTSFKAASPREAGVEASSKTFGRQSSISPHLRAGWQETPRDSTVYEALVSWSHKGGEIKPIGVDFFRSSGSASYTQKQMPKSVLRALKETPVFELARHI